MKREILFRGLAEDGRWYYGDLIVDDMGCRICYVVNIAPSISDPGGDTQFIKINVDFNTIGQFTGIKDSQGNKIFEGDILYIDHFGGKNIPVTFGNGCFYTNIKESRYRLGGWDSVAIKILGDIYQNKNLL